MNFTFVIYIRNISYLIFCTNNIITIIQINCWMNIFSRLVYYSIIITTQTDSRELSHSSCGGRAESSRRRVSRICS